MRAGQGALAAKEMARALSLIDNLTVDWYPAAVTDTRGYVGIMYIQDVSMQPPMSKTAPSTAVCEWVLEVMGPSDAMSSGSQTEAKYLDLMSSEIAAAAPVSVYDALRNHTRLVPPGWQPSWRPLQPQINDMNVFRKEESGVETVLRVTIEVVL